MATNAVNNQRKQETVGALLLEFFGSMKLAITLLVTVGIASIVGTVLKQNEPYQNYISKFGPFWFEVFNSLGLYDVYSAACLTSTLSWAMIPGRRFVTSDPTSASSCAMNWVRRSSMKTTCCRSTWKGVSII